MAYRAEYIWIDGTEPTAEVRSKTKVLADGDEPGIWGFDGSSTNQATGDNSDVVLQPVFQCPDPIRGGDNILVMCETLLTADMSPHPTNTRAGAREAMDQLGDKSRGSVLSRNTPCWTQQPVGQQDFPLEAFPLHKAPTTAG